MYAYRYDENFYFAGQMVSALGQFEEFEKELERISRLKEKLEE